MNGKPSLIHLISSNRWGGSQRYALDICTHYHGEGWEVMAMTRDAKTVDDRFRRAGIPLLHAPLHGFFDPASSWILARTLRRLPRDRSYVHVHRYRDAFTVLLAKRIAKRPDIRVISTRHKVRPGRNSWLFRRIYDKINAHIFVSRTAFERFRSPWPDKLPMREKNVHIQLNSINIAATSPVAEPERGPIFAIYQGTLVRGKGLETAIDALASLRDLKLRLRIAGQGNPDYLDELRRRAMARNVMEMIDWKISPDVPDELLAQSHFAVLPSVEREGFGLPNLRVMAAGRPQICTPSGAQSEYLSDGETALFVPPADAHALATAMRRLASDATLRAEMGAAAYARYMRDLSWQSFVPKLTEIYLNT
jgi:glycosyltransferase involved in cell wall biosynthesis